MAGRRGGTTASPVNVLVTTVAGIGTRGRGEPEAGERASSIPLSETRRRDPASALPWPDCTVPPRPPSLHDSQHAVGIPKLLKNCSNLRRSRRALRLEIGLRKWDKSRANFYRNFPIPKNAKPASRSPEEIFDSHYLPQMNIYSIYRKYCPVRASRFRPLESEPTQKRKNASRGLTAPKGKKRNSPEKKAWGARGRRR